MVGGDNHEKEVVKHPEFLICAPHENSVCSMRLAGGETRCSSLWGWCS